MSTTAVSPEKRRERDSLSGPELLRAFRIATLSRRLDDREIQLKRQNRVFFQISGAGHEAVQVARSTLYRRMKALGIPASG